MAQLKFLLCFLITLIMIVSKSSSQPSYQGSYCPNTTMFATKSRYETNLNTLFRYFVSNTSNPSGYHASIVGNGTHDVVYGHFMCRGDELPSSCNNCVTTATTIDLPKTHCPNRKEAFIWYDECFLRYSYEPFFGSPHPGYSLNMSNIQNVTGNVTQFMDVVSSMMKNMIFRAANGGPNKKFARGIRPYSNLLTIYGMEQCTPDISSNDCNACLINAIGAISISKGARIFGQNCNVRFEVFPFLTGDTNLTLPPPSPPGSDSSGIVPVPSPTAGKSKSSSKVIRIVVPIVVLSFALLAITLCIIIRKAEMKRKKKTNVVTNQTGEDFTVLESLQYDLETLQNATDNFSDANKLGEGGFGSVYKGTLPNGRDVAVKRLSRTSCQGVQEFKNELVLVAKLQHRNLARLVGFCLDGDEKLLVYEYAPNKSLDNFIFDPIKQATINWGTRKNIIHGIARGILYLHQDSRLTVIHRDLKASNILLDANMNPKISDFGMARIFDTDQSQTNTSRVVGTFGYMSPEYIMHGQFSTKSDVYSFGVLVLEIISGKRNCSFRESGYAEDLISYAWKLWKEGTPLKFLDPTILGDSCSCSGHEVIRCVHLGLLCVQESVEARPTIETIAMSLDSFTMTLPVPNQPAFFIKGIGDSDMNHMMLFESQSLGGNPESPSMNDITVSEMEPR